MGHTPFVKPKNTSFALGLRRLPVRALLAAFLFLLPGLAFAQPIAIASLTSLYPVEGADYFLENVGTGRPGSGDYGCHGQGIKFDGAYFYSTCMDTNGQDTAILFLHNSQGQLVRSFNIGSRYEHPSGILLSEGWAYTGFTHNGLDMESQLYRFNRAGQVQNLGFFDHSVGFVGPSIASPSDPVLRSSPRFYSYDQYYARQCSGNDCASYADFRTGYDVGSASRDGVQDCDTYFRTGRWYKACLLFSSSPARIRVWNGGELKLAPGNALATVSLSSAPGHAGGFGFYTDPSGKKWIVLSVPPSANRRYCQGCALVGGNTCACTDKNNRQRVRFLSFDRLPFP